MWLNFQHLFKAVFVMSAIAGHAYTCPRLELESRAMFFHVSLFSVLTLSILNFCSNGFCTKDLSSQKFD
jgi:hypothetical protein